MDKDKLLDALNEIKTLAENCIGALSGESNSTHKSVRKAELQSDLHRSPIVTIVKKIKDCDEADKIEAEILDKTAQSGRVLLPFFICHKYFPQQTLTTGDIEKITSELGVKVKTSNVSTAITKSLQKYLDGSSTRKKGRAVSYKLNRKGAKYFESLLTSNEE